MKVVVAHNYYSDDVPSGENDAVDRELQLLHAAGYDVEPLSFRSSQMRRDPTLMMSGAIGPIHSPIGARAATKLLSTFRPDVLHMHNPFPLFGPALLKVAKRLEVPVVQTVHNYRHECVNGLLFRDGEVCELCPTTGSTLHAVRHGCYRNSRIQTVPMVLGERFHRGRTWNTVSRFLPVSSFLASRLMDSGIDPGRITVKPNAIDDPGSSDIRSSDAFVASRLTSEKGIDLLLEGWIRADLGSDSRLRIAGSGPLQQSVEQAAAENSNVEFLGWLTPSEVAVELRRCGFTIAPSTCFEGFPTSVVEAMAHGRPTLAFEQGSLGEIIDESTGFLCGASVPALAAALREIRHSELVRRGANARRRFEREHTASAVMATLEEVYLELAEAAQR